ncbi:MAG: SDR family oxidoreductase [Planctomycetota bacterium]
MAKCLVTGGAGFIGSHIVAALVKRGDQVRVLDNFSTGRLSNLEPVAGQIEVIRADLCDAAAVEPAVAGVDTIFHQAALASVPASVADPLATHHACVTGTVTLLNAARQAQVRRVVYAASSSAYGNSIWSAKRETDMPMTLSPYAAAKVAAEWYCQAFYHSYNLETVAIRYFNVFGPRQDPNGAYAAVIPRFICAMVKGERPTIYGDGQQSRDFVYIDNVVAGNLAAATAPAAAGKLFNIAAGRSYSLLDLLRELNTILNTRFEPNFEPTRVGDVRDSLADISAASQGLNYQPLVSFQDGLRKTVEYYRTQA